MSTSKIKKKRSVKKKEDPEVLQLFDELVLAVEKTGVEVRHETGQFTGGFCLVEEKPMYYLNRGHSYEVKIEMLAQFLKTQNLENIFLPPRVRDLLEPQEGKEENSERFT